MGVLTPFAAAESHLMRFADVHQQNIVFTYEGDLWSVSVNGGDACRITHDAGIERFAKFSPDGKRLAFTANYDGGTDVYLMDARGGEPTRLTYHPASDDVLDWYPDGKWILFRSHRTYPFRGEKIYRVSVEGGLPEPLPVDRAGLTALSPDASQIAYNRISRESRTWKRYRGGMAQDIWIGSLEKGDFRHLTDWPGTDNYPMWWGDAIYYTSDREFGTLNLYRHNLASGEITAMTSYRDYDVKYPSLGKDVIVYQYAESLHLLDLKTGDFRKIEINIPTDLVRLRPAYEQASGHAGSFGLSPKARRMVLETRGEIVHVPVKVGEPVNLTATSNSREKNATWSPDGKWIAFISDRTGEEEIYLVDARGTQPWRQLTKGGKGFLLQPAWSPDGTQLAFADKYMKLRTINVDGSGVGRLVDQGQYDDAWDRWGIQDYVWSPDGKWIAYTKMEADLNESIFLFSINECRSYRVTNDRFSDFSPSFDPKGRYLYFLSDRTLEPIMGMIDQNHTFSDVCRPYLVILKSGEPSPFAPKDSDVELESTANDAQEADETTEKLPVTQPAVDEAKSGSKIDTADFERRTIAVEGIPAGNYFRLEAIEKGFLYMKKDNREFLKYQTVNDHTGGRLDVYYYKTDESDADKRKPKKVLSGIANYHLSANGKKLVYRSGSTYGVVDAGKKADVGDGKVDLGSVKIKIDRKQEYLQIFNEAWRVQRDWFYDPGMHGVDWNAVGEMYRRFVPFCGNRSDLNYLIGEMIGQINAGHTYVYGGDVKNDATRVSTGLLGVDFEADPKSDYYRIAHIIPGHNWRDGERSPLRAPGCSIKAGDYLIAIDGVEVRRPDNPYRLLENRSNRVVRLTTTDEPKLEGATITRVKTIGSERAIRYREWVERNRAFVEQAGEGRIGYVHLPDMMEPGLIEFARAFYPVHARPALIIDIRYNGGGFVGDMIIDRLERKIWALTQPREGKFVRNPERVFHGHIFVVMNEDTGSNGEYFAEAIKLKGLAHLIGMRTWGGAVGIEPHQLLVDGGTTTPPQFAPYGLDGRWLIEGHGVVPDTEVQNMPGDVIKGRDAQLEAAIAGLLEKLVSDPMTLPERPAFPVKAKPKE
ncbi:MAG: S41 family peptidase [Phycisphaerae bacterium]